jgi:hypothetical protein
MKTQSFLFVAFFMAVPAICLICAWGKWFQTRNAPAQQTWREELPKAGVILATLALLLTSGFLYQGFYPGTGAFSGPPPRVWLILNWISLVAWVLACFIAALGKGRLRPWLFLWCVTMPLFDWLAIMSVSTY